jgi:hypothetical protein
MPRHGLPPAAVFLAAVLVAAQAATARADDCAPIRAAYEKLAAAPAYRQIIKMPGQPPVEARAVGDMFYMRDGDGWESVRMKPGGRAEMMSQVIGQDGGLSRCAELAGDAWKGAAMKVYSYQPPAMGDVPVGGPQTLWVGAEDGLPRRMTADTVELEISYEDVKAPAGE